MKIITGGYSEQGRPKYNEDRMQVKWLKKHTDYLFAAVFDGHGGEEAANYCIKRLADNLDSDDQFDTDLRAAITSAFIATDLKFLEKMEDSGATAVVALIHAPTGKLWTAHCGDSRCVLSANNGVAFQLTEDHKPTADEERARIEAAGHDIIAETHLVNGKREKFYRIDGIIAVSRSIGDGDFKDNTSKGPEGQAITCVPDIGERQIEPTDEFLLIACDGLFDVMSNEDAITFAANILRRTDDVSESKLKQVAQQLTRHAVSLGSNDNVTALIVHLNPVRGGASTFGDAPAASMEGVARGSTAANDGGKP
mmetsp:Transcript_28970/g.72803  ORF Transcript_28970/g.72803 Transcript_28970/m.72803 type:complete len:310 (+) Transcript_28970:157-1086(+)